MNKQSIINEIDEFVELSMNSMSGLEKMSIKELNYLLQDIEKTFEQREDELFEMDFDNITMGA